MLKLASSLFIVFVAIVPFVHGRIRQYSWDVKYEYKSDLRQTPTKSPDCFQKLVVTINGVSPGPTILARRGDTVVVEVTNSLVIENLAIHWHGTRQRGTPWFDGSAGVTQCPILPGDTFEYEFVVDKAGTYLYHAHYGLQKEAGLYGSIQVVLPLGLMEPYAYDYDTSIILNDWYHQSTYEQATGLSSIPFVWSLLIQGKGRFNCSDMDPKVCNASNPECYYYTTSVVPEKTYRLRISSLTSLSALSFQIEGHNLTIVEADCHNVEPFTVQNLFVYSGESYLVVIKADQDALRNYWMTTDVVSRNRTTPQGLAILNYYPNDPKRLPPTNPPASPAWNEVDLRFDQSLRIKALQGYVSTPPQTSDRVIILLNMQNKIDEYIRWAVNNVSLNLPNTPYLIALKQNLSNVFNQSQPPSGYDFGSYDIFVPPVNSNAATGNSIYRLDFNTTVDIVLQNANTLTANNSETHPWHLHGHDFWVLGYGKGKFDEANDPKGYNLVDPVMKNTVPVHPYGWTALRFRADNPGVWMFHCHVDSHFYLGMSVVFESGIQRVGELPPSIMGCGATKGYTRH